MPIALQNNVVYGPIHSRRLGLSLGINILPTEAKFCLSNCLYCQYGWTELEKLKKTKLTPAWKLLQEIESAFDEKASEGLQLDAISFCGNGEPTLHPELELLAHEVKRLRNRYFPQVPITILSDSSRVHYAHVRRSLTEFDERFMKLDAGDEEIFHKINQPLSHVRFFSIVEGLRKLQDVTIQTCFIAAPVNTASDFAIESWIKTLSLIRPKAIHVYTVSRSTADPSVMPVSFEELIYIARRASLILGVPTKVF